MMKFLILISTTLILQGCISFDKRAKELTTKTEIEYRIIPDEYFNCSPPPVVEETLIDSIVLESEYNEALPLPLYENNVACYNTIQRIQNFNEETKKLNIVNENNQE